MIPRVIHQTWKTDTIPDRFRAWSQSWTSHNPGWRHILWSDRMLLDFVAANYPNLLGVYCSYPLGIMRADAARYMLLHHFGGIYTDIDAECLGPLDSLLDEERVVLCHEPPTHWPIHAPARGLRHILFNGTMASPAGHPLWRQVIDLLPVTADARDVLDATGPLLLTAAVGDYPDQFAVAIHSCHLFNAFDVWGNEAPEYLGEKPRSLARHHWAGTWYPRTRPAGIGDRLRFHYHHARQYLTRGPQLDPAAARAAVDARVLRTGVPTGDAVAVLVPLRDAAEHIRPFLDAIDALDYPKRRLKLVFCEGDSSDDTFERLSRLTASRRESYREIVLLRLPVGHNVPRDERWKVKFQRARRTGIARVRNRLIADGLDDADDWALWIDIDMWGFPADIIQRLQAAEARIATPNCVTRPGGASFDRNSFVTTDATRDWIFYRDVHDGLHQPPEGYFRRLYLSDLRYLNRVSLDAVGGTMLLVDAALHRAGLRFPELPYRNLIETEGFGALARDLGVSVIGLPKLEVMHVPW